MPVGAGVKGETPHIGLSNASDRGVAPSREARRSAAVRRRWTSERPRSCALHFYGSPRLPDRRTGSSLDPVPFRRASLIDHSSASAVPNVLLVVPWDQTQGGVNTVVRNLARFLQESGGSSLFLFPGNSME